MLIPSCILSGENFDPTDLVGKINDVTIEKLSTTGEIGLKGRYKGKPMPYGLCKITGPANIHTKDKITWMTRFMSKHIVTFNTNGATEIELNILWKGHQGNIEFTADELKEIANLRVPMTIDYVFLESED